MYAQPHIQQQLCRPIHDNHMTTQGYGGITYPLSEFTF